ncbi:hypothetical protein [Bremerella cremea]|uniref:hypothetical protein n=1 Tax=Bremerella cremea TaxID=1031537 RepID=UPI0031E5A6A6
MNIAKICCSSLAIGGLLLAAAVSLAADLRGQISEVKGPYFKISTTDATGLKVGSKGVVEATVDGQTKEVPFVVTVVADGYVVGQSQDHAATVGEAVRFLPEPVDFDRLLDEIIDVQLTTGRQMDGITLKEVAKDNQGNPVALIAQVSGTGLTTRLSMSTVESITYLGRPYYKASNSADDDNAADDNDAGEAMSADNDRSSGSSSGPPRTRKQILEERAAKKAEELAAKNKEKNEKWLALAERNRVRPWPEFTKEECEATTKKEKEIAEELKAEVPNLSLYETKYFLVFSNANPPDIASVATHLDTMHQLVSKMYQVDPDKVYKGKLPVYIFANQQQFVYYEQKYMNNNDTEGVAGLCHSMGDRSVVTTYITTNPNNFAHTLVHESSHAETRFYRSGANVPRWFNEGLADYVSLQIVPQASATNSRRKEGIQVLQQTGTLGGLMRKSDIRRDEYGVSSLIIEFLVRTDGEKFVELMDLMKAGMGFEEAIVQSYGASSTELAAAFGQSIGIPQLSP